MADTTIENLEQKEGSFQELNSDLIFEKIFRVAPQIAYVFNLQTQRNEYSNREIGNVLGYSSEEIRDGGSGFLFTLIHPDDLPRVLQHHARIAEIADGDILTIEYRIRNSAGNYQTLLSRETIFDRDETGAVLRMAGVATDVTDRISAQSAADDAAEAADAANEDLRAFTYSVSHELRSPAITVQAVLEELRQGHAGPLTSDAESLINEALKTIKRMQRSVAAVLDFNRLIDAQATFGAIELMPLAEEVISERAAEIEATGAQIAVEPLPKIYGDREHIRVLIANIIGNAIKYTAPGTNPDLKIWVEPDPETSGNIRLMFQDQGIGIDPEFGDNIYKMFWRGHTNQDYPGSGLGLALCQRIAQAHGGHIAAKSDGKSGTLFTITLPKDARVQKED